MHLARNIAQYTMIPTTSPKSLILLASAADLLHKLVILLHFILPQFTPL